MDNSKLYYKRNWHSRTKETHTEHHFDIAGATLDVNLKIDIWSPFIEPWRFQIVLKTSVDVGRWHDYQYSSSIESVLSSDEYLKINLRERHLCCIMSLVSVFQTCYERVIDYQQKSSVVQLKEDCYSISNWTGLSCWIRLTLFQPLEGLIRQELLNDNCWRRSHTPWVRFDAAKATSTTFGLPHDHLAHATISDIQIEIAFENPSKRKEIRTNAILSKQQKIQEHKHKQSEKRSTSTLSHHSDMKCFSHKFCPVNPPSSDEDTASTPIKTIPVSLPSIVSTYDLDVVSGSLRTIIALQPTTSVVFDVELAWNNVDWTLDFQRSSMIDRGRVYLEARHTLGPSKNPLKCIVPGDILLSCNGTIERLFHSKHDHKFAHDDPLKLNYLCRY